MNVDENQRQAVRQALELVRILKELLRRNTAPDDPATPPDSASKSDGSVALPLPGISQKPAATEIQRRLLHRAMMTEATQHEFKSNAMVEVIGEITSASKHLRINGAPKIPLTKPEFVLFLILLAHARLRMGLSSSASIAAKPFLSVDAIIHTIDAWRAQEPELYGFWSYVTFAEVHRTVFDLREKIRKSGTNPNIIETGRRGAGYRLSVSPYNVIIVLE